MYKTINRHRLIALLPVMLLLSIAGYAQKTDTLGEVNIQSKRPTQTTDVKMQTFAPGQKVKTIDSTTLQQYQYQSIANLLTQQVPVFVKSYGINGLATLNFRGSSAAQSEVLWNGVPIQNAALGLTDVSLLPVLLADNVHIVYGGDAALWGSGNVGGALMLEDEAPVFDHQKRISAAAGGGSYGQYEGGIKAAWGSKKWYASVKAFGQLAKNNFEYTDENDQHQHLTNSHLRGGAIMAQAAYKPNDKNILSLSAWYQNYYREIPPALFETFSDKQETDASLRLLLNWEHRTAKNKWYAKAAFINDYIHYEDSAIAMNSRNTAYQYYQEIGWEHTLNNYSKLLLFAPVQVGWINVTDSGTKQQTRIAIAGAYKINAVHNQLNIAIDARGEAVNNTITLLPGINASYQALRWLQVRGNVQRTYRVPTLNELYYNPGGNKDLKPEQGWNEDAGYTVELPIAKDLTLYHDLSVYNRVIKDWILWLGGAIWTPHNIAEVHSRGIETENRLQWQTGKWQWHLGINTSYVLATTMSSYIPNDGSIGKQIPYTPRYNGQLNAGFAIGNWYVNYNHTYTGYRFITTDESQYLKPYQTGNLQLMYTLQTGHYPVQIAAQVNNIWNEQYQVVGFRPMPGINWLLGLKVMAM